MKYKRTKPRPVVALPLATQFNEVVAMDIKEIKGYKVLHMVDHATRYSVAAVLKTKEAKEIVSVVYRCWIAYFGAPKSFLTDNGREFDNSHFREMAQSMNSIVRTTAAHSPWSNGLNERHNGILGEMVVKTMEDINCSIEISLGWSVSAKNSLSNVRGYSANQLVFGYNPNTPSVLVSDLPALETVSTSEVVANNLNAMHAARRAFMMSESSERLQRALRHQVRTDQFSTYQTGDMVYFKRPGVDRWMGPGTVIGSEHKQVLVKHGGSYVRVHPCRLQLYRNGEIGRVQAEPTDLSSGRINSDNDYDMPLENDAVIECLEYPDAENETPNMSELVRQSNDSRHQVTPQSETVNNPIHPRANPTNKNVCSKLQLPKPGDVIKCKLTSEEDDQWTSMKVISRGGKATGANKHVMNVSIDDKPPTWLDFKKSVTEWKISDNVCSEEESFEDSNEVLYECNDILAMSDHTGEEWKDAKESELSSWKENSVYEKVRDVGQDRIQTRWVCTTKETANGKMPKARLVARGFQDQQASLTRSDSPTCAKESLRLVLMVVSSRSWGLNAMDIKTAFLQGMNFEREVYVVPPKEAAVEKGYIWKLNKCVYGLTDASRVWYLTVKKELTKLGMCVSSHDEAVFTFHQAGRLQGIVSTHVDDF